MSLKIHKIVFVEETSEEQNKLDFISILEDMLNYYGYYTELAENPGTVDADYAVYLSKIKVSNKL